ncbi:MAG: kinase [Thermoplasmatales archaeon]
MRRISVFSPYRVSFIGGGTDVPPFPDLYGGCVINATIDIGVTVRYVDDGLPLEIASRDILKSWSAVGQSGNDFLNGISRLLKINGIDTGRLTVAGDVPAGTGLGSSTSLVLALLTVIKLVRGESLDWIKLAGESYRIERDHFRVTLGLQDPYAIPFPGLKYVEFAGERATIDSIDASNGFSELLSRSSIIIYTGSTRNSSMELQEEVSKLNDGSGELIETLLEMKKLTLQARDSVAGRDFGSFCKLMSRGWELKKKLGQGITNEKVDSIIEAAIKNGACTARLMGGGSAGFILAIAPRDRLWHLETAMMDLSDFVTRVSFLNNRISIQDSI